MSVSETHVVTFGISMGHYSIDGTFACTSLEGSRCRLECSEECGAEQWPCGPEDARHTMRDSGGCQAVLFLEQAHAVDAYVGTPDHPLSSGPVVLSWEGDFYGWRMADDVARAA